MVTITNEQFERNYSALNNTSKLQPARQSSKQPGNQTNIRQSQLTPCVADRSSHCLSDHLPPPLFILRSSRPNHCVLSPLSANQSYKVFLLYTRFHTNNNTNNTQTRTRLGHKAGRQTHSTQPNKPFGGNRQLTPTAQNTPRRSGVRTAAGVSTVGHRRCRRRQLPSPG